MLSLTLFGNTNVAFRTTLRGGGNVSATCDKKCNESGDNNCKLTLSRGEVERMQEKIQIVFLMRQ